MHRLPEKAIIFCTKKISFCTKNKKTSRQITPIAGREKRKLFTSFTQHEPAQG